MPNSPDILWLSASPSLQRFDQPLLRYLAEQTATESSSFSGAIARWEYYQTPDEASSLAKAVALLHDYLKLRDRPIHLAGHGISGTIALTYARRYPERVQSVSLLAVAARPAVTWHAHYYVQRQMLPCSRQQLLAQMARSLFGSPLPYPAKDLVQVLDRDLEASPCLHSLFKLGELPKGSVMMPLLVCSSHNDPVVDPQAVSGWRDWTKSEDALWQCPDGHHFFHYFYPQPVGDRLLSFWQGIQLRSADLSLTA